MREIVISLLTRSWKLSITKKELKRRSKSDLIRLIFTLQALVKQILKEKDDALSNAGVPMLSKTNERKEGE